MEGSSAETTINPPLAPVIAELIKGSAATLSPTCFIQTMALLPAYDIPNAVSIAVFSLADHIALMPFPEASLEF